MQWHGCVPAALYLHDLMDVEVGGVQVTGVLR